MDTTIPTLAKIIDEREAARAALAGLPYAAIPLNQLADIYKRFLRLTRMGQHTLDEWDCLSEAERDLKHRIFEQADFGAVFAGQWLPKELRDEVRWLVKGRNWEHQFEQHVCDFYHRQRLPDAPHG